MYTLAACFSYKNVQQQYQFENLVIGYNKIVKSKRQDWTNLIQ